MKHVFVVQVHPEYAMPRISGEAYETLDKAQWFIEHRSDTPERVNAFYYKGRSNEYTIHELALR
jgi:hypothetical protein